MRKGGELVVKKKIPSKGGARKGKEQRDYERGIVKSNEKGSEREREFREEK